MGKKNRSQINSNKALKGNNSSSKSKAKSKDVYIHKHNPNPNAHGSKEKREELLKGAEIKRIERLIERLKSSLSSYLTADEIKEHDINKQKMKSNNHLNYVLKGAARPAQEYYLDPNLNHSLPQPSNIFESKEYKNKLSNHSEGRKLLLAMVDLAHALHNNSMNNSNNSKKAIKVLNECIEYDINNNDRIGARYSLLRILLDMGEAGEARSLIQERFPHDTSSCFLFGLVLIEHVDLMLGTDEDDDSNASDAPTIASENHNANNHDKNNKNILDCRLVALRRANQHNKYTIWSILRHNAFTHICDQQKEYKEAVPQVLSKLTETDIRHIANNDPNPNTCIDDDMNAVSESLLYWYKDSQIWQETEGAVEYLASFINGDISGSNGDGDGNKIQRVPPLAMIRTTSSSMEKGLQQGEKQQQEEEDDDDMLLLIGFYNNAIMLDAV